jgi:hypothetical protein
MFLLVALVIPILIAVMDREYQYFLQWSLPVLALWGIYEWILKLTKK